MAGRHMLAVLCITLGTILHATVEGSIQTDVEKVRTEVKQVRTEVKQVQAVVKQVQEAQKLFAKGLTDLKGELNQLKTKYERGKVAFSGALSEGNHNSADQARLFYKRIFTNVGNAYNSSTGDFTAPVKGVYFFTFMTFGYNNQNSGIILTRNGVLAVSSYDFQTISDQADTTGNSVILQLEAGEKISLQLWGGASAYDSANMLNTFNGFLLYPL
ncbi:hypothetical protein ACEWY4_022936 [Coilia grayii]|uniref:C1q domain-containing protein n=1 Tax=Coilia grayii TaxID=363190 RepID=A0ABD1J1J8_9TELE